MLEEQIKICNQYGSDFVESSTNLIIGISVSVKDGVLPVHGLRIVPDNGTCGWFIWAGDYSEDPDFFKPLHAIHLNDWCPWIFKYLGLAPGFRFLVTRDYEDVWRDETLVSPRR